jgi:hypothetical protein
LLRKSLLIFAALIAAPMIHAQSAGVVEIANPNPVLEGESATLVFTRTNADAATDVHWYIGYQLGKLIQTGTTTLQAGESVKSVAVPIPYDPVAAGDRRFPVVLSYATNGYTVSTAFREIQILEKDLTTFDFDGPLTAKENAGTTTIFVRRSGSLHNAASISYQIYGTGLTEADVGGAFTFAPNETLKGVVIKIADNDIWRGDRTFQAVLYNLPAGGRFPSGGGPYVKQFIVQEDEPLPKMTVADISMPELNSGRRQGFFTVKLSGPVESFSGYYGAAVYNGNGGTAAIGTDYEVAPGDFSFDRDHTEAAIPFTIIGDTTRESHETLKVSLYAYSGSFGAPLVIPPDPTCTILNDETDLTPDLARVPRGQSAKFALDIGLPATAPLDIPLQATNAAVVSMPPFVHFNPGQSTATFSVTGRGTGSARVSVPLPAANGGQTLSTLITVHDTGIAVFEPSAITVFAGDEATVRVSLDPASTNTERLPLAIGNTDLASVTPDVSIPAGGSGTFRVTGLAPGTTAVRATLPSQFGGFDMTLLVDVIEKPATPAIVAIEPSTGSANGGTIFLVRGSLLTADCRLLFGAMPAHSLALTSDGMLIGATPPHAAGIVDVTLQCGADTFILTDAFTYIGVPRVRSARH